MGEKYIISEYYDFTVDKNVLKEAEEKNQPVVLKGILQKADTENRNGRVYPYTILKREADKYMEIIKNNGALGEVDHPDSAIVSLATASHKVVDMWWEDKTLYGKIELLESLSDIALTPSNILKSLLKSNVRLGISSRGIGSVKSINGKNMVQEDFELIAFDFVSSPSTPGAYLNESKNNGLVKLTDSHFKVIHLSDLKNACDIISEDKNIDDKYKNLLEISKNDFWKIIK
jgi:hypothetical protein